MYFLDPRGLTATNLVVSSAIGYDAEDSSVGESGAKGGDVVRGPIAEMLEEEVIKQLPAWLDRPHMVDGPVAVSTMARKMRCRCIS